MEEAFVAYLAGSTGLTAIVGDRIDWAVRPQAELTPSVVLHNIVSTPVYSDEGFSGLTSVRIQVDHWAKTYALAKQASRETTQRLTGTNTQFTYGGFFFQSVLKEDEQDTFEQGAAAEELYRVRLDFIIMYKET